MGEFDFSDVTESGGSSLLSLLLGRFPKVQAKKLQEPDKRTSGRVLSEREERDRRVAHALWMAQRMVERRREGLKVRAYKTQRSLYFFVLRHNLVTRQEIEVIDSSFCAYHLRPRHRYNDIYYPKKRTYPRPTKQIIRWLRSLRRNLDKP